MCKFAIIANELVTFKLSLKLSVLHHDTVAQDS